MLLLHTLPDSQVYTFPGGIVWITGQTGVCAGLAVTAKEGPRAMVAMTSPPALWTSPAAPTSSPVLSIVRCAPATPKGVPWYHAAVTGHWEILSRETATRAFCPVSCCLPFIDRSLFIYYGCDFADELCRPQLCALTL